jgi:hypothetical protein
VQYSVGGGLSVTATLSNNTPQTHTGNFIFDSETFTFLAGVGAPSNFLTPSLSLTAGPFSGPPVTLVPGQLPVLFSLSAPLASPVQAVVSGLNAYIGVGTFQALVDTNTLDHFEGTPPLDGSITTSDVTPEINIEYDFTTTTNTPPPVPEPTSLGLLVVGLAGLGAVRRRKIPNPPCSGG